jgi:uncharacterized protein
MMPPLVVLLTALLLGSAPSLAVPPPPEQVAADCAAPTYASDLRVCGDAALRALDARMREAWAAVDFAAVVAPGAWVEAQQEWFRRRSLCAFSDRHADCLQGAYLERVAVLEALRRVALRLPRQGTAAACLDAPWGRATVHIRAPAGEALAIEDTDARVLAAATPLRPGGAWTPYLGFGVEGGVARLVPMDGRAIVCSPVEPR